MKIKNPILKIGAYIIMGFFTLIIIISFGMPDFLSRMNRDQNTAAIVNGTPISRLDVIHTIDSLFGDNKDQVTPELRKRVLERMIFSKLILQFAAKEGITVSDERVANRIHSMFSKDGIFDQLTYNGYLYQKQLPEKTFFEMLKEELMNMEFGMMVSFSTGASPDEVEFQNVINGSSFQMRYVLMSNDDLMKKFGSSVSVTDKEIDDEMAKNKGDIVDPKNMKADREKFRKRIIDRKISGNRKALVAALDDLASKNEKFEKSLSLMGGVAVKTTDVFKPGDQIKEQGKDGKVLYLLSDSEIFRNDFARLGIGASSRAIETREGIYVFTPLKKDFEVKAPDEKAT
ncbi:MAG TPA: SurA N-terminal domain-containing protein, partial [Spirochaetota bacterium]|nr:SurA N-terminal domain-containing protein [Spirochaetota bacterium]